MSALSNTLNFIANTIGNFFILAIMLRFLLQIVRADFYNPVSQAVVKITSPLLHPIRRIIPGFKGVDTASLILAIACKVILLYCMDYIGKGFVFSNPPFFFILVTAIYLLINLLLKIYLYGIIIVAVASWVAPGSHNPVLILIYQIIEPIAGRVRRFIPPIGGIDFSLMVVVFAIIAIQRFLPVIFTIFS